MEKEEATRSTGIQVVDCCGVQKLIVCIPPPPQTHIHTHKPTYYKNQLRHIHAVLEEENQLRPSERYVEWFSLLSFVLSRVDSDQNRKVVYTIIKEIGTEKFTEKQIKGIHLTFFLDGVRIYRKTLKEASKGRPSPVKTKVRIRSRQQRVSEPFVACCV